MKKPSHSPSNGQETRLAGFDVPTSVARDNMPRIAPQSPKLAIVYGTCCRCKKQPAVLKSPSGQSIYCAECGRSRCGIHTIADFELEDETGLWLDPCAIKHNWKQQNLIEK